MSKVQHTYKRGGGTLDTNNIVIITGCIILLMATCTFFKIPILKIIKLIINSILGGCLIFIINIVGAKWGIHIGLNIITSILIGICGIPGAMLLLAIKFF